MNQLLSLKFSKKYLFPNWKPNVIGERLHGKFKISMRVFCPKINFDKISTLKILKSLFYKNSHFLHNFN